jgi:hypothetical protein
MIVRLSTSHHDDPLLDPRSGHMGFVVHKVALGRILFKYFGFPRQLLLNQLFNIK